VVRAISRTTTPELVNGRVPQHAIEPGDDRFVGWRLLGSCDDFRKRVLQDVLRKRAVTDASLQIVQERAVILEQHRDRRCVFSGVHHPIVAAPSQGSMV
jgi:hypothetical protein